MIILDFYIRQVNRVKLADILFSLLSDRDHGGTGVVICLPPIISCFSKIQNGLPFWCRLTRVVLEKRPLNVCVCACMHACVRACMCEGVSVCVRLCALIFMQISQKWIEIEAWYQLPTNRKWPVADRMMTSSMTSHDRERSRS